MLPWKYRLFLWGINGVFAEVVFTAVHDFVVSAATDRKFAGSSSIWSFFLFGLGVVCVTELLHHGLAQLGVPLLARCALYVPTAYVWQIACGLFLDLFGARHWDCTISHHSFSLGVGALEYALVWFLAGLYFEWVMSMLKGVKMTTCTAASLLA